jgi:hypothetical protein
MLHLLAFGGAAALLWCTGWIRRPGTWLAIMLGWTLLDEATQAIPALGRSTSAYDVLAGQLGVAMVVAWRWALAPRHGTPEASRWRYAVSFVLLAAGAVGVEMLVELPADFRLAVQVSMAVVALAIGFKWWRAARRKRKSPEAVVGTTSGGGKRRSSLSDRLAPPPLIHERRARPAGAAPWRPLRKCDGQRWRESGRPSSFGRAGMS